MKKIGILSLVLVFGASQSFAKHCDESAETKKYPSIGFFKDLDNEYCSAIRERVEILKKLAGPLDDKRRIEAKKSLDYNSDWVRELFGDKVLNKINEVDSGKADFTPGKKKDKQKKDSNEFVIDHVMGWSEGSWNLYKAAEGIDSESPGETGEQKIEKKKKKQRFWLIKKWNAKRKLRWVRFAHMFDEGFFEDLSRRATILDELKDSKTTPEKAKDLKRELSRIDSSIAVSCPECHQLFVDAEEVPVEEFATRKSSEKVRKETFKENVTDSVQQDSASDGPANGGKVFDDNGEGQGDWKPIPKGDDFQP